MIFGRDRPPFVAFGTRRAVEPRRAVATGVRVASPGRWDRAHRRASRVHRGRVRADGCCLRGSGSWSRPRIAGSQLGPRRVYGGAYCAPFSTSSAARSCSTGRVSWSTARRCEQRGGPMTGPNPVDRGKSGSKLHVLSDRNGIPLTVAVSTANTPTLPPCARWWGRFLRCVPGAGHVGVDRGSCTRTRHMTVVSCGNGCVTGVSMFVSPVVGSSRASGGPASVGHRTRDRLAGRLSPALDPLDRKGTHYCGFLTLAAALTRYKRLAKARSAT